MLVANFTNDSHGDGFAFYLSNLDYQILIGRTGSAMGIALNMSLNSSSSPFFAIDFDTFANEWDVPHEEHVGIDINSTISVKTTLWMATSLMHVD
ncbi:unnamed protein product [Linum tenue]|uniref:Legume lectin domain-containing protein n=1 Tax=Linum tenue TaxID=586396 RepID=A0AAV0IUE0_9ROSI|nr:unnamed protein product [Linum tenue]